MELNGRPRLDCAQWSAAGGHVVGQNAKLYQSDSSVFDPIGLHDLGRTKLLDFNSGAIAITCAYATSGGAADAIG